MLASIGVKHAFPCVLVVSVVLAMAASSAADDLQALARDFWAWRSTTQPITRDDVPRADRPPGWAPDWSPTAMDARRAQLSELAARWQALSDPQAPVAAQVDHRLLGSGLARVRWELDGVRSWRRDPGFYVDQTVSAVVDALLPPPPFDRQRALDLVARVRSIPATLSQARANLDEARAPFARQALADLDGIGPRLQAAMDAVGSQLPADSAPTLRADTRTAAEALDAYRAWLHVRLAAMPEDVAIGREAYLRFLRTVALIPFEPEELLAMGRQELARAIAFQAYEAQRDRGVPEPPLPADTAAQIALAARGEDQIRAYLAAKELLTVPVEIPHYRYRALPPWLRALRGFGEETDFASLSRPNNESTRWIPEPSTDLGFFALSMAQDPRADTVHEGVPGHAFQLALGYRHPDEVRRHWYDSGVNEGLGTYSEEMMLQAGLFDDSPRTREMIYRYLRLRALRVEADVQLALGGFSIDTAAEYLQSAAHVDAKTARDEAASFAADPGFAIGYLIGKLQINRLLADAARQQGEKFRLRDVHDYIWRNGNVPLSLLRFELLGDRSELSRLTE
jgi:Bacterial protein of unknown function (DUF885)